MSNEIVDVQDSNVPAILDESIVSIAKQAEARIEAVNKIKQMAIRVTNHNDWVNQQGKPYLQVSGAEKIARLFGISWHIEGPVMDNEEDGHFSYTYTGKFMLSGATIEAIGTRSSRDGFFNRGGALPPAEIDKGDLKKAAYTNCIGNGITRLLGIRNLTWEELKGGNIEQDKTGKVDYKKDGKNQENISSEGSVTVNFIPSDVKKKTGEKNGKPWTQYIIKGPSGDYKTFSETFAKSAMDAKTNGLLIGVTYKAGQYGNDIENVGPAVYPPEEGGGEEA